MDIQFKRRVRVYFGQYFKVDSHWKAIFDDLGISEDKAWWTVKPGVLISKSRVVTHCFYIDKPQAFYYKSYIYPFRKSFEYWMRTSKAGVEAFAYSEMQQLNIACPEMIGFAERRYFGLLFGCFIATKAIPNTQTLADYALKTWYFLDTTEKNRIYQQISSQLVDYFQKAHQAGLFHYDLKWRNILLQTVDHQFKVIIIDPPRARKSHFLKKWHRIRDLSALARLSVELLTPYQKLRFLAQYLGENQSKGEAKMLYRQIEQHLAKRFPRPLKQLNQD